MSKLYELSNSLVELDLKIQEILVDESISDDDRERLSNELLDSYLDNEGEFVNKLDNCVRYINELEALSKARKDEAARLTNLASQTKTRADDLRRYVLNHLARTGKTNIETTHHRIFLRKNNTTRVVLDCESPENLPEEYKRVKVEADKIAIKQALKNSDTTIQQYAHLEMDNDYSLVIR